MKNRCPNCSGNYVSLDDDGWCSKCHYMRLITNNQINIKKNKFIFWNPLETYIPKTSVMFLFDNGNVQIDKIEHQLFTDCYYQWKNWPTRVAWLPLPVINKRT